ncbi:MAG: 3-hydroxybutyryl-CoA dehydrogenase [Bacteroidetes bacterium]|nr:3-hydroxybutyryl-CoA dehydrogenase [Bacteroidota bacterium]
MKKIAVIGSGTMGNGITHLFSQNGFQVVMIDIVPGALEKGLQTITKNLDRQVTKGIITGDSREKTLHNIRTSTQIAESEGVDLAIEAVTENPEIKLGIFGQLDQIVPPGAILASNTSSISITKIASATNRPGQVIGMHFMNPVPVMKLIEVIRGYKTTSDTTRIICDLVKQLGKVPVEVNDYPGFISNRILMPMINEAIESLFHSIAGVEEIDTVMKLGMAHPMGPLRLADFIGLDVCLAILNVLHEGLGNPKYAPCPLLINMVAAGNLGVKSGEGFYSYRENAKEPAPAARFRNGNLATSV